MCCVLLGAYADRVADWCLETDVVTDLGIQGDPPRRRRPAQHRRRGVRRRRERTKVARIKVQEGAVRVPDLQVRLARRVPAHCAKMTPHFVQKSTNRTRCSSLHRAKGRIVHGRPCRSCEKRTRPGARPLVCLWFGRCGLFANARIFMRAERFLLTMAHTSS